MKKYLFLAVAAVTAFAFTGCKENTPGGGEEPESGVKISVVEKNINVAVGEEVKIRTTITPAGTTLKLVYTSSNPDVATVSSAGLVTGVATGEAQIVVSAEGATSDTCFVTVKDAFDVLSWNGWALWDLDKTTILSNDTLVTTLKTGETVHCVMIPGEFHIWDNGITYTETAQGGTVSGAGEVIICNSPIYLITDSLDEYGANYYYLGTSTLQFVENFDMNDTAYAYCATTNAITGTADQHMIWLNDTLGVEEAAISGIDDTYILYIDYDNQKVSGYFTGLVGKSIFDGDENEALYKANISWFDPSNSYYGLALNDSLTDFKDPLEFAELLPKYYEYLGESTAETKYFKMAPPAAIRGDVKFDKKDIPTDRLYMKK